MWTQKSYKLKYYDDAREEGWSQSNSHSFAGLFVSQTIKR
jgi:hypothetical protein